MANIEEKEAVLRKLVPDVTLLHVSAWHFAILWSQGVHTPCMEDWPNVVFKIVLKEAGE